MADVPQLSHSEALSPPRHVRMSWPATLSAMHIGLAVSVLGWSLIWAQALSLVALVPDWVAVALFLSGFATIPLQRARPSGIRA